jgi:hypothetical protein
MKNKKKKIEFWTDVFPALLLFTMASFAIGSLAMVWQSL